MRFPVLYFTLGSPDAYLAIEPAERVLDCTPQLEPVLLGAIFDYRGWGSWAAVRGRAQRVADVERRALSHGFPPVVWPPVWPGNPVGAMRAAVWANTEGAGWEFVRTMFRRQFAEGAELSDPSVVMECAAEVGLEPSAMMSAIQRTEVKRALVSATQQAWDAGVRGVPTVRVGQALFAGERQLELAVAHLRV